LSGNFVNPMMVGARCGVSETESAELVSGYDWWSDGAARWRLRALLVLERF